ncbi:MAG TPA: NAD(P)-dependent oxidoreductase [Gemmatimonadaceae bacterium]
MTSASTTPRAAFIGLGAIGTPMARHVAAGTRLAVWNRTRSKAAEFAADTGARDATSPADAADGVEFLIICLPTSAQVEQVLFGVDGAAARLTRGSVVIDCTSGDPATSRKIAERLAAHGIAFIDAPVSGGVVGAVAGKLTVMVGGDAGVLGRARTIIELFAGKIVHCGAVGTGDAVKAVNNAFLAVHIWSTAEGLAMLCKLGVDPAVALDVVNSSSGRSNSSINLFPERVLSRTFPRTFRLALLDKDVGIAAAIARETGTPAELLDVTARLFAEAHRELGEEADHVEAVKVLEQRAGTTIGSRAQ